MSQGNRPIPRAFLSHASEDKELVRRLALFLHDNGVDTFFDEWEMRAGDSIRRKIEEGLIDCTHFLVVLSPISIGKEWVNLEIDAAFVRKVGEQAKFVPVVYNLPKDQVPPLIAGMLWMPIDDSLEGAWDLLKEIHDVPRKPPVEPKPNFSAAQQVFVEQRGMGELHLVPALPDHYVERTLDINALKSLLIDGSPNAGVAISGVQRPQALQGMGGIGKTVLATALARDEGVRRSFPDGVYWITLGQNPDIPSRQAQLIEMVSGGREGFADDGGISGCDAEVFP